MKPTVALVGRPNVGKSTLFNRLTRSRSALVSDQPGVTRDRQYGDGRIGDRPYYVVDTGGLVESFLRPGTAGGKLLGQIAMQTAQAIGEADSIIFVLDAREGITPADREIADALRRAGKPVWLAVNKAEGLDENVAAAEFHALGLGVPHAVSAAHGEGVSEFMDNVLAGLARVPEVEVAQDVPRIAVIGRPNAGKSTLVNAMLGEARVLVSDEAGTTRDSIAVPLERGGQAYVLIDTAGVRRRHRVHEAIEKFSAIKTLDAVAGANVVILVIDADAGVGEQDVTLGGYALEKGRALVVVVNKWDLLDAEQREWVKRELDRKCPFLSFVRVHYLSALSGEGLDRLFSSVQLAFASSNRTLPTARLNRVLQLAVSATPPPVARGRRIRPKFAHQAGRHPPTVVIHGNLVSALPKAYRRYLSNRIREDFGLSGIPVRIECREGENPFAATERRRKPRVKVRRARKVGEKKRKK
jgi:GTP-binding protein